MKLTDHFNVLLKDTVNLGQVKLDLLDSRVESVYKALKADEQIGPLILGKTPQGSWAHKTIINPVGDNEFDADFMLDMSENPDWADDPEEVHRGGLRGSASPQHLRQHAARTEVPLRPSGLRELHAPRHRSALEPRRRARGHRKPRRQRLGTDQPPGLH